MDPLAIKYRPRTYDQVIGQGMAVTLLNAAIKRGAYHSYLFWGIWGSGKTSLAYIYARALNCQHEDVTKRPCGVCDSCTFVSPDYIYEVDAGVSGGVQSVRIVQEKVLYRPLQGKILVVIFDEAHSMTKEAMNACLKLIETPPKHVYFIFVTTELGKMLDTVRSRCLSVPFVKPDLKEIAEYIVKLAEKEGQTVSFEKAVLIVRKARGIVRDSLELLERSILLSVELSIPLEAAIDRLGGKDVKVQCVELFSQKDRGIRGQLLLKHIGLGSIYDLSDSMVELFSGRIAQMLESGEQPNPNISVVMDELLKGTESRDPHYKALKIYVALNHLFA